MAPTLAPEPLLPLPLLVVDREEGTIAAPSLLDVVLDELARVKSLGCRCSRAAAGEALKLFISFVMTFSRENFTFLLLVDITNTQCPSHPAPRERQRRRRPKLFAEEDESRTLRRVFFVVAT